MCRIPGRGGGSGAPATRSRRARPSTEVRVVGIRIVRFTSRPRATTGCGVSRPRPRFSPSFTTPRRPPPRSSPASTTSPSPRPERCSSPKTAGTCKSSSSTRTARRSALASGRAEQLRDHRPRVQPRWSATLLQLSTRKPERRQRLGRHLRDHRSVPAAPPLSCPLLLNHPSEAETMGGGGDARHQGSPASPSAPSFVSPCRRRSRPRDFGWIPASRAAATRSRPWRRTRPKR